MDSLSDIESDVLRDTQPVRWSPPDLTVLKAQSEANGATPTINVVDALSAAAKRLGLTLHTPVGAMVDDVLPSSGVSL